MSKESLTKEIKVFNYIDSVINQLPTVVAQKKSNSVYWADTCGDMDEIIHFKIMSDGGEFDTVICDELEKHLQGLNIKTIRYRERGLEIEDKESIKIIEELSKDTVLTQNDLDDIELNS